MSIIELCGVKKAFGSNRVLRGIDFKLEKGETLAILGGSGTGKSVILKTIIGLLDPDEGTILYEGKNITHLKEKDYFPIRKEISYLFQGGALFDSMNVFENLAFPLRQHSTDSEREIREKVSVSLQRVGMGQEVEKLYPPDLSGGMMKRIALARAIINHPRIILYDEPTTGLDPLTAKTINELIVKMQKDLDITSIVVTHDMSTVFRVADQLAFLQNGLISFFGSLEEAKTCPNETLRAYLKGGIHE
ncbi:MAG: ABC transporter ATP-binding protein [Acidobacteria bacterium]|nr:MAG: ABC transporter ATP-binding protein [Acidobacteriota bacterium]